jgi:hypothetical protein
VSEPAKPKKDGTKKNVCNNPILTDEIGEKPIKITVRPWLERSAAMLDCCDVPKIAGFGVPGP